MQTVKIVEKHWQLDSTYERIEHEPAKVDGIFF